MKVFDSKNIYLQKSDEFQKQMKNLKWLLGLPFEITARVDTEYLQFNDGKDDLRDDALKRDAFFASMHTAVALDVMKRMLPGTSCDDEFFLFCCFFSFPCSSSCLSPSSCCHPPLSPRCARYCCHRSWTAACAVFMLAAKCCILCL